MTKNLIDTLSDLCALHGPSGDEKLVAEYLYERAKPHADEIRFDGIGNLFVFKKGKKAGKPAMICAHMDEVGFIVRAITSDGLLKIDTLGGIDRRVILGRCVRVLGKNGFVPGVIGLTPTHLASDDAKKTPPKMESITIDIGASSKEEALELVSLGDSVSFVTEPALFGNGCFKGKAIDDRVGCAVLLSLIESEEQPEKDTWFVFTVQEEVGGRGATVASFAVDPAQALILEGTTAADIAGVSGEQRVCIVGEGAVISYMDRSTIYDPAMFRSLSDYAEESNIAWQVKTLVAGGTDAGRVHVARAGIPCAGLAVPVRYIHAPVSVVSIADIERMQQLAMAFMTGKAVEL
ncbi:MAG TPA: M42 family metallopeptidase [Clostridiales bacterium]|nr:M42 family metallopeptidase [Clostridiales bacterium]